MQVVGDGHSFLQKNVNFWQVRSSRAAESAARTQARARSQCRGPCQSMREGHALPSDGSGGQSFPLSHRPPPLPFCLHSCRGEPQSGYNFRLSGSYLYNRGSKSEAALECESSVRRARGGKEKDRTMGESITSICAGIVAFCNVCFVCV